MIHIPPKKPYVLAVVPPVRFDHISYEGEIWYDSTGRMLEADEVCHALNWLAFEQFGKPHDGDGERKV